MNKLNFSIPLRSKKTNSRTQKEITQEMKKSYGSVGTLKTMKSERSFPIDIVYCPIGNCFYVSDRMRHQIRKISKEDGHMSILAGSGKRGYLDAEGRNAQFRCPMGIDVDAQGNVIVADSWNDRIRIVSPKGMVSTLAGDGARGLKDGSPQEASFRCPLYVVVCSTGAVYVTDTGNNCVRIISNNSVSTMAGDGAHGFIDGLTEEARFFGPTGIALRRSKSENVYISDERNHAIRKITSQGVVQTVAGYGISGHRNGTCAREGAQFNQPHGMCVGSDGSLYIADTGNNRIRVIAPDGTVNTLAGAGEKADCASIVNCNARFDSPVGLTICNGYLYVAERSAIRMIDIRASELKGLTQIEEEKENDPLGDLLDKEKQNSRLLKLLETERIKIASLERSMHEASSSNRSLPDREDYDSFGQE